MCPKFKVSIYILARSSYVREGGRYTSNPTYRYQVHSHDCTNLGHGWVKVTTRYQVPGIN